MENKHKLQEYRRFSDKIAGIVDDYMLFHFIIDENDGIYVDENLNVTVKSALDIFDRKDFYPITSLVRVDEDSISLDYDAIDELTANYVGLE